MDAVRPPGQGRDDDDGFRRTVACRLGWETEDTDGHSENSRAALWIQWCTTVTSVARSVGGVESRRAVFWAGWGKWARGQSSCTPEKERAERGVYGGGKKKGAGCAENPVSWRKNNRCNSGRNCSGAEQRDLRMVAPCRGDRVNGR